MMNLRRSIGERLFAELGWYLTAASEPKRINTTASGALINWKRNSKLTDRPTPTSTIAVITNIYAFRPRSPSLWIKKNLRRTPNGMDWRDTSPTQVCQKNRLSRITITSGTLKSLQSGQIRAELRPAKAIEIALSIFEIHINVPNSDESVSKLLLLTDEQKHLAELFEFGC